MSFYVSIHFTRDERSADHIDLGVAEEHWRLHLRGLFLRAPLLSTAWEAWEGSALGLFLVLASL